MILREIVNVASETDNADRVVSHRSVCMPSTVTQTTASYYVTRTHVVPPSDQGQNCHVSRLGVCVNVCCSSKLIVGRLLSSCVRAAIAIKADCARGKQTLKKYRLWCVSLDLGQVPCAQAHKAACAVVNKSRGAFHVGHGSDHKKLELALFLAQIKELDVTESAQVKSGYLATKINKVEKTLHKLLHHITSNSARRFFRFYGYVREQSQNNLLFEIDLQFHQDNFCFLNFSDGVPTYLDIAEKLIL